MRFTTQRISGYDLAQLLGGDAASEAAVLQSIIALGLNFVALTQDECEAVLDHIHATGGPKRMAAAIIRDTLASSFSDEKVREEGRRPLTPAPSSRYLATTRTAEYRRSDLRRALNKRFRRTRIVTALAEEMLLEQAERLVDVAIVEVLGEVAPGGMNLVELSEVLDAIMARHPGLADKVRRVHVRLERD